MDGTAIAKPAIFETLFILSLMSIALAFSGCRFWRLSVGGGAGGRPAILKAVIGVSRIVAYIVIIHNTTIIFVADF